MGGSVDIGLPRAGALNFADLGHLQDGDALRDGAHKEFCELPAVGVLARRGNRCEVGGLDDARGCNDAESFVVRLFPRREP